MNILSKTKVENIIESGYRFDFGHYINEGIEIVKKNDLGLFVGYTAIYGVISFVINLIPFVNWIASLIISPPLVAGFFIGAHKAYRNEQLELNDFFKGFDYLGQLVVQQLIIIGIMLAVFVPVGIIYYITGTSGDINPFIAIIVIVVVVILMYLIISYTFAPMLIIFGGYTAWDSMETSRRLVAGHFWELLGLVIVIGLINIGGALLCLVGLLFTLPVGYAILYSAFKSIVRLDEDEEHDIFEHFVDQ